MRRRDHVTAAPRLLPDDTHNRTLVQNVHPAGWRTWGTDEDFGGALEEPGVAHPLDS